MLSMQADDFLLQYSQVILGIEMVKNSLKKSTEPFSIPITRYFSGAWNESLAKFTPYWTINGAALNGDGGSTCHICGNTI
jgi:hypothetical protein